MSTVGETDGALETGAERATPEEVAGGEARPDRFARVPWPAVAVFAVVAFGLAWAVALPLWLIDFEDAAYQALFSALAGAMMFTPAVATVVALFVMKQPLRERMRLLGFWPLRPARRVVWFTVAMLFAAPLLVAASLGVAALFGWVRLDLVDFSGFQQTIDAQLAALGPEAAALAAASMPSIGIMVAIQLAAIPVNAFATAVPALGEEIGWRGWLLPALRPLGVWPALLLSGAVWGLWHAPVILLGYNFNRTDWTGVALMTVGCVCWGVFFGWLRLRTASVWPAVLGHGALNASAGLFLWLGVADAPLDMALVNPLGVSGWIVLAVVIAVLAVTGQLSKEPELAPARPKWTPPVTPS